MELFKQKILASVNLSDAELRDILSAFKTLTLKKGQNLIDGQVSCKQYYFLEKGLLRLIYSSVKYEATAWVIFEGIFFTELISMKTAGPSNIRVQCLEDCTILVIDKANLDALCNQVGIFERYLRLTWEENLYNLIQMKLLQQFSNARERYESLIRNKDLMQRIPQKYLASILGITPTTLSRLRKQITP